MLGRPGPASAGCGASPRPQPTTRSASARQRCHGPSAAPRASRRCRDLRRGLDQLRPPWPGRSRPRRTPGRARATGQAPHAGLRAWQTRRPWKISRWLSIVQSLRGNSAPTSASTLTGSRLGGPAEPAGQPPEVGVHGDAGHAERVAEHDVGRLAPDPGQGDQVLQPAGHLAAVALDQGLAQPDQRVGLGPEEAGRTGSAPPARPGRRRRSRRRCGYFANSAGVTRLTRDVGATAPTGSWRPAAPAAS